MAFTEFYAIAATGSNVNAGSTTGAAAYTATNGGWNSGTGVFTPTSGDPSASVAVGDFCSVYTDGATVTGFVARVTAVSSTTITLSTTAKMGTAPGTSGTGISLKAGGAWKGPNGTSAFPFGVIQSTLTNAAGDMPRVTMIGTFSITAAMTHNQAGPIRFQGATATAGDGGRATIDGGTSGAAYGLLTVSVANIELVDLIFQNNGASSTAAGLAVSGTSCLIHRCVFHDLRGYGASFTGGLCEVIECEAYNCNQSNTGAQSGFTFGQTANLILRCISHDNSGSNSSGFILGGARNYLVGCIADTNGQYGFHLSGSGLYGVLNCDSYNNTSDGLRIDNSSVSLNYIENCNFVKNGGWGVNGTGAGARQGALVNCGFGSGSQVNTSGTTSGLGGIVESGSITYASGVTPWVDPTTGDFRVSLAAAKGAGRGTFTQTQASYTGAVAYSDIGSGQHQDTGSSGGYVF